MADEPEKKSKFFGEKKEGAPFNMALATLERINELLKDYQKVSLGFSKDGVPIDSNRIILMKHAIAKQMLIQTIPLVKSMEDKKEMRDSFYNIKFETKKNSAQKELIINITELNKKLDDFVMDLEELLQEDHYFMPSKKDARFGWKQ